MLLSSPFPMVKEPPSTVIAPMFEPLRLIRVIVPPFSVIAPFTSANEPLAMRKAGEIEAAVQNQCRVLLHAESRTGEAVLEHNRKALAFIGQRDGLAGRNRNRAAYNEALVCGNDGVSLCRRVNGLLQRASFAFADICAIDSDRKLYSNTGRNRPRIRVDRNICRACFDIEVGDIDIVVKCPIADGLQLAFALALFAQSARKSAWRRC